MPVLVPVLIGMGGAAVATSVGASVATAAVVGVGAAVISKKSGVSDKIYEEIFKPVGDLVVDVVGSDIGNAILKVAAVVTGNTWAVPLIDGAKVAANGGDIGDVLKATAISYIGQTVGDVTGKFVTSALADTGASDFLINTVVAGTESATRAIVYGQDPLKAFVQGGLTSAVSAGLGEIDTKLRETYGETFENLDEKVKQSVFSGLRTELSGGDLTDGQVGDIISKYTGASNIVNEFLKDNVGLTAEAAGVLTRAVSNGVSVALAGGSGLDAFSGSLSAEGAAALKTIIDKPVYRAIDKVTGAYRRTEEAADALTSQSDKAAEAAKAVNAQVNKANGAVASYNTLQAELAGKIQTQDALKTTHDTALATYNGSKTQANADAVTAAITAYNKYATNLEIDYNDNYKDQLAGYKKTVDTANAEAVRLKVTLDAENVEVTKLQRVYDDAMKWVVTETDNLDVALKPKLVEVNKAIALTLRPGIDEDTYRDLNGLDKNADVFDHYLRNQSTAQAFDPAALGDKYSYDATTNSYYVDTPDGRQEVDPYAESMAGATSYDAPTMQSLRAKVAPVEFLGRITKDMSNILGDEGPQGGIILPTHFKALKDAGYNVVPYRDPTLGKTVDGTVEYDTMVKDFEGYKKRIGDEDLAMSHTVYDPEYGVMSQPVEYTGKTFTLDGTTPITSDIQNIIKKASGYDNAYMQRYFPVGEMLDFKKQGVLPVDVVEAFYDAGYAPPEQKAMDAVSQNIANKIYTKDSPYDFDNIGDLLGDTVGLGVRAIGQLAETFNYANAATNWLGMTDYDIPNTLLGKAATFLEKTGMDMTSPQYKEALEDYNQGYIDARSNTVAEYRAQYVADNDRSGMSKTERAEFNAAADAYAEEKANSFVGGAKTIFGGIGNAPGMFFNEVIASEVMQELPILGAGLLVKGGSLTVSKAAGREISESVAIKLGLGAGVTLDFVESFGGGAQQGINTAYNSYIEMNMRDDMDPPQRRQVEADARAYAEDAGMVGGMTNMLITGISMGVINANSFEKLIVGGKKVDSPIFEKFVGDVRAVVTEAGQEAAEEGGTAAAVGLWVGKDDPSVLASLPADISQGAILGSLAGGGTAGSLVIGQNVFQSTGNPVIDTLIRTNAGVQNTLYPEYAPPGTQTTAHKNPNELKKALQDIGVSDNAVLNTLLNTTYDAQFVTTTEAGDMFVKANPGFTPTDAEIAKFAGTRDEAKLAADIAAYVDPRFLDVEEVKAAALAEGITLTDEQAAEYAGQKNEVSALKEIKKEYDPQSTNRTEAEKFFTDLGFTPTKAQIDQFVGATAENTQKTAIGKYVDPRQTTEAEARQMFKDLGYTPTDAEVNARVGQGGAGFQANTKTTAGQYVDPRQTTEAEVRQMFKDLGYEPTDAEVNARVGQGGAGFQANTKTTAGRYVDPRQTTEAEVRQVFKDLGYEPTDAEVNARVGQRGAGFQANTKTTAGQYVDPRQTTEAEVRQMFKDLGYEPTDKEVAARVGQGDAGFQANTKTTAGQYVDPRFLDADEVKAAALAEGITLTDEQAEAYVGQKNEASALKEIKKEYDPKATTRAEAEKFFTDLGFTPTDAEIAKFVGAKPENTQKTAIDKYVDPRFLDADEVKAAALAEGITLTDEQAKAYVGQKDEGSTVRGIRKEYDPQGTTRAEAEKFFADLGYTPTEKELTARVGATPDAQQKTAIGKYVDPRQVTEAEARKFYEDLGFTPTDAELAKFVGQGGSSFEKTAPKRVENYVDPRQVTDSEARKFFEDLGYNPTDKQVAQFVAQVEETTQQDVISKYVDPRQVTQAEVQAIADQEGLTLTETLAATYLGQSEAKDFQTKQLDAARAEYDPLATTLDEATQFFADTGYTATTEEIAGFVASKTEEAQTSAIGAYVDPRQVTAEEAQEFLSAIGYQPTQEEIDQFTGQVNDENYQVTQKAEIDGYVDPRYVDAGEVRATFEELGLVDVSQEDVDRFVGQFDEETQLGEVRDYLPTATFNSIKSIMGSPAVEDDPNTDVDESKDATGIYAELEAGATRDEALEAAIGKVATNLGTTKADLLAEIGFTKDELSDEIGLLIDDVTGVKEDVADVKGDVSDIADIIGTEGVVDDPDTDVDETQDPTGLFATIAAYEKAGLSRDEALQAAIGDVSTALGTTRSDLLDAIGESETSLGGKITDVETNLGGKITDVETSLIELINKNAGDVDAALEELATALGTTEANILAELGTTTETLRDEIAASNFDLTGKIKEVETNLGTDIQAVSDLVGKPARDVTQADVDFVIDLIAQENVAAETLQQYDVTGDGVLDINDQNMLTSALQGDQDVAFADTSIFNPATGLYLQQETDTQTTLDAIIDMNTQINTNIDTRAKERNINDMMQQVMASRDAAGQQVTVDTPDPMNIDYLYDISGESIFATPSQAQLFGSPYGGTRVDRPKQQVANTPAAPNLLPRRASGFAEGGQVEDETDMLLRILGDT